MEKIYVIKIFEIYEIYRVFVEFEYFKEDFVENVNQLCLHFLKKNTKDYHFECSLHQVILVLVDFD